MFKRSLFILIILLALMPVLVSASHVLNDTINTPSFSYAVNYSNDNPRDPNNPQPGDDLHYFPDAQAQNIANALNNSNVATAGNPNGYHAGYTDLGFKTPDFGGTPRNINVFDCSEHGGCDNGNAPADRINIPTTNHIQDAEIELRRVTGHELFHHVQYAYITFNKWSAWGTFSVEGTARMMEDKIYSDIDGATPIRYVNQVNSFLGNPNQTIWNASYSSALFWTYLTEQLGTTAGEPNVGVDFVRRFWEQAEANNSTPDNVANMRRTINDFNVSETLENIFHDFTIANIAKDLDVSALDDALKYRYTDENDGTAQTYQQVPRSWSGTIPPKRGPDAENVLQWGARYYEANIGDCSGIVGFRSTGDQAAYSLLAVKGIDDADRLYKSVTDEFARAFILRSGADRYTRLIAVVAGLADPASFTYTFDCGGAEMEILEPTVANQAYVGEPDEPDPFLIRLNVYGPPSLGTPSVQGLDPGDFEVYVGGEDPANEAPILSGAYVQGEYWLVAQAPIKGATGTYPLLVKLGDLASDTKEGVVRYEKKILDQVLVIDRSGSMLSPAASPRLDAAKNAASLFVDAARSDDKLGVVSFGGDNVEPNDDATLEAQLKDVTNANRTAAKTAINSLNTVPSVLTSIGDGMKKGRDEFPVRGSVEGEDWIVLLSDGMENEALFWNDIKAAIQTADIKVHAIALGPYADQALMQAIATDTGGRYYYVDVAPGTLAAQSILAAGDLPNRLADAYALGTEAIRRHDRIFEVQGTVRRGDPPNIHTITLKEGGVQDGIFSINWNNAANDLSVRIQRPDGTIVSDGVAGARIYKTETHVVAQVGNMMPGDWIVEITGTGGEAHYMLILSGKNREGARLRLYFAQYHPDAFLKQQHGLFMHGLPQPILVALYDIKGAIRGAHVMADVEHPDGGIQTLMLFDDGNHGDGDAGDGIYGNLYTRTTAFSLSGLPDNPKLVDPQRGSYNVAVTAQGVDNLEQPFNRIQKGAFQVFEGESEQQPNPDGDKDGMPTRYEELHQCLDPEVHDAREDPDRDKLLSGEEYERGTDPCDPDTDDGGESDFSEVKRESDPFDPADDILPRPIDVEVIDWRADHLPEGPELLPRSNLIRYPVNEAYALIRLYRSTRPGGPFTEVAEFRPDDSALYRDTGLTNDQTYFYYLEGLSRNGLPSSPSPIFSGTPKGEPVPPIGHVSIELGNPLVISREVILQLGVDDDDVTEMRISNSVSFTDTKWIPFQEQFLWKLAPQTSSAPRSLSGSEGPNQNPPQTGYAAVYVQFRDKAGNLSTTYSDDVLVTDPKAMGGIKGRAILEDANQHDGIFVQILDFLFSKPAFTDVEGMVFLSPLPLDTYDLRFEREGYMPQTVKGVQVKSDTMSEFETVILERTIRVYLPMLHH